MSDGWEGILDPGEEVLWQGRPEPGVRFDWSKPTKPIFFAIFTLIAIFMTVQIMREGGFEWLLTLPFVAIGLYQLVFVHYWDAYMRQNTRYTITTRRALIATERFGTRKLDSYPLDNERIRLSLQERDGLTDIYFLYGFGEERPSGSRRRIGLLRLADGRHVYELMRRVQAPQEADA
jgi:hypothetical protein